MKPDFHLIVQYPDGERRFRLDREDTVLGQDAACSVRLADHTVSRRHAVLRRRGEVFELEDLGSTNGCFVNGKRVVSAVVEPGNVLRFGQLNASIQRQPSGELSVSLDLDTSPPVEPAPRQTQLESASARFLLTELPALVAIVRSGASVGAVARSASAALARAYPGLQVSIEIGDATRSALIAGAGVDGSGRSLQAGDLRICWQAPDGSGEHPAVLGLLLDLLQLCEPRTAPAPPLPSAPPALPRPEPQDRAVRDIYRAAGRVGAARDIQVLIEGESGTGKELLAHYLHQASAARGELVAINCSALPRDLLEAELFGIERGVATGVEARAGRFEQADAGTLFLDEIGEMSAEVQVKLLRVLQEGRVHRLGAKQPRKVDVRIVAATNRELLKEVEAGRFRLDLYHRIADWCVRLPPLRERPADLLGLAAHFLERACRRRGIAVSGIARDALVAMRAYAWPGNVRELEREMMRAALFLDNGQVLDASLLSQRIVAGSPARRPRESSLTLEAINQAITASRGNMSAAATQLGVNRSTLYRRMHALGLVVPGDRE